MCWGCWQQRQGWGSQYELVSIGVMVWLSLARNPPTLFLFRPTCGLLCDPFWMLPLDAGVYPMEVQGSQHHWDQSTASD